MKELPELHKQAKFLKNRKRLQHDGGRAWIKDSQLHEAIKGANYKLVNYTPSRLQGAGKDVLEKKAGNIIQAADSGKTF
ncbi:MAG: hypothetical protein WD267_13460 [Balneolales bacterium]